VKDCNEQQENGLQKSDKETLLEKKLLFGTLFAIHMQK